MQKEEDEDEEGREEDEEGEGQKVVDPDSFEDGPKTIFGALSLTKAVAYEAILQPPVHTVDGLTSLMDEAGSGLHSTI